MALTFLYCQDRVERVNSWRFLGYACVKMDLQLRILTLNCWGIPAVSKFRRRRVDAIGDFLVRCPYEVVSLQEVWLYADFEAIREKVKDALPYSHYFHSGVAGSGICVFSAHPLLEAFFHPWPLNGYMHKVHHGDWFGGKGVGLCRIRIRGFTVNVYCAHLHAEYERENDEYLAHRIVQAYDAAQFIRLTSAGADLAVLAGDLNTEPGDIAYRIFRTCGRLSDSLLKSPDAAARASGTNDCARNSFRAPRAPETRIDYIMFGHALKHRVRVPEHSQPLPQRIPDGGCSYSDHEAVGATLQLWKPDGEDKRAVCGDPKALLEESAAVLEAALAKLRSRGRKCWFWSAFVLVALVCTAETGVPGGVLAGAVYKGTRIAFAGVFFFVLGMATLWSWMEGNAILAGKKAMQLELNCEFAGGLDTKTAGFKYEFAPRV